MSEAAEAQAPDQQDQAPANAKPRKQYDLRGTIKTVGGYTNPKNNEEVPSKTIMVIDVPFEYNEEGFSQKLKDFTESLGVKATFNGPKYNNTWSIVVPDQETAQSVEQFLYASGGKMYPCTGSYYQQSVDENKLSGWIQGLPDGSFETIVNIGFKDRGQGFNESLKKVGTFDGRLENWKIKLDNESAPVLADMPIDWAQDFRAVCEQELGIELPPEAPKAPAAPSQENQQAAAPAAPPRNDGPGA